MQAGAFSHSANFSVWEESKQQPCVQHRTRHHTRKSEVARAWYNLSRRRCHTRRLVAAATAAAATSTAGQPTGRVFRATCPLEGWEPIEAVLRERFPAALALHHYVLVEALRSSSSGCGDSSGTSSSTGDSLVVAFDFLPSDPTSHFTAATLLRGGAVQGGWAGRRAKGSGGCRSWHPSCSLMHPCLPTRWTAQAADAIHLLRCRQLCCFGEAAVAAVLAK